MPHVELLLDAHATLAESPLWEPRQGVLYWVDIRAPALFRLDPVTLENRRWNLPEDIGGYALLEGNEALLALRSGLFVLSFETGSTERIAKAPWDPERFRFNESAVDAAGRFWVGCMYDPKPGHEAWIASTDGPLHSWTAATGLVKQEDEAKCHNGMGWSPEGGTFYLSHTQEQRIYAYAFEQGSGRLGKRQLFVRVEGEGKPDGAAVDEEGAYWCAMHGASCLHRYAPDGTLLTEVALPVSQPTMCAFGGPELRTLYVTSASEHLSPQQLQRQPHAGGLFMFEPGVRGVPKATHAR